MKTMNNAPLSLDGGLRSNGIFNHPHSVEARGKAERRRGKKRTNFDGKHGV